MIDKGEVRYFIRTIVLSIRLFAVFTVIYAVRMIIAFVDVNKTYLILQATQCLYIRPAVCIASVSICIRPDLV